MRNIILSSIGYTLHVIGGLIMLVSIGWIFIAPIIAPEKISEEPIKAMKLIASGSFYRIGLGILLSLIGHGTLKLRNNIKPPAPTNPE